MYNFIMKQLDLNGLVLFDEPAGRVVLTAPQDKAAPLARLKRMAG